MRKQKLFDKPNNTTGILRREFIPFGVHGMIPDLRHCGKETLLSTTHEASRFQGIDNILHDLTFHDQTIDDGDLSPEN